MRSGQLTTRVEFIQATETADSRGGSAVAWTVYRTKWSVWHEIREKEELRDDAVENPLEVMLTIRYDSTITPAMRVRKGGKHYGINSIVDINSQWLEIGLHEMRKVS